MFRKLSDSKCLKNIDDPSLIVKCVIELRDLKLLSKMLSKAVATYVRTGRMGPFLTLLGSLMTYSESGALSIAINLLINESSELPPEIFHIITESLGPVSIIKHALESGIRLPKQVISSIISGMGCYELSSLSLLFRERSPDKAILLEFIRKALKSPWCPGTVEDAIKMLTQGIKYGVISTSESMEVLRDARVKVVIKRRGGELVGAKILIGDRIIGNESAGFVMEFIHTASRIGLIKI